MYLTKPHNVYFSLFWPLYECNHSEYFFSIICSFSRYVPEIHVSWSVGCISFIFRYSICVIFMVLPLYEHQTVYFSVFSESKIRFWSQNASDLSLWAMWLGQVASPPSALMTSLWNWNHYHRGVWWELNEMVHRKSEHSTWQVEQSP